MVDKLLTNHRLSRLNELRKERLFFFILVALPMCFCAIALTWAEMEGSSSSALVTVSPVMEPTLTLTPTILATSTPELMKVEYQVQVQSVGRALTTEIWYTSERGGQNQKETPTLTNGGMFSATVYMPPGEHVELAAFLANNAAGQVICRIIIGDELLEESSRRGTATGVHCAGAVPQP